jgi:hypothetical protein
MRNREVMTRLAAIHAALDAGISVLEHQNVGLYSPKTSFIAPHTSPIEQRSLSA